MIRKYAYLSLLLSSAIMISCQKEPDESILEEPPPPECTLTKVESLDGGTVVDTAGYVYTSEKITRINYSDFYHTLQYAGDKVTKRGYFEHGSALMAAYDTIYYNGDGTIAKVETYVVGSVIPVLFLQYDFSYSGGKLTKLVEKADTALSGMGPVPLYEYDYTYTGNNITRAIERDLVDNVVDTLTYQYNSTANYFTNRFFTELFFSEINGQVVPLAFSANNATALTQGSDNYAISYNLTPENNLRELLIDNEVVLRYSYKCN